jgi:Mce-associated membrane protein
LPTSTTRTVNGAALKDFDTESAEAEDTADATPGDEATTPGTSDEQIAGTQENARSMRSRWRMAPPRLALLTGLTMAALLTVLIVFLGIQAHHANQSADLRGLYLQVGRQGAVNLTTIDWQHADADVQRILGAATGPFYDDFSKRSQPFIDVVKQVQSVSVGTVTVAGLESSTDTDAQVLVAVSVQTTTREAQQPTPRAWRMRVSLQKTNDGVKVSNVEFVP